MLCIYMYICIRQSIIVSDPTPLHCAQTFNGMARMLGIDEVMAIKAFKSMNMGQDWGGPEQGMELSFQWAPYAEAQESRAGRKSFKMQ